LFGVASQDGFGKLPAIVVGNIVVGNNGTVSFAGMVVAIVTVGFRPVGIKTVANHPIG
jgi:hypothetical protein